MYTGIIHENDVDFYVATSMGIKVIKEKAFEAIANDTFEKALQKLNEINYVIDAGYPVGVLNEMNTQLIKEAVKMGKKVFSVRAIEEGKKLFKGVEEGITFLNNTASLVKILSTAKEVENGDDI
ncbi:hypothetical protein TKV_c03060 [Thermoanaerobacter kivui]|uniref:Uncharacterized protein n=1 Tax=Thermoanaerobacter kivui TaxID=2325 RepID=A0A097ANX7_THEKI|nr:hypothetical protein [Thermoanaerobacter kivui]AIS51511.1 hypothetical protein TKV_c03060 [Thermoanaerobacter kivui]